MNKTITVDLLVIGSGAAGVCAALYGAASGRSVMLCEKAAKIGGTTALSNAMIWVPCSDQAKNAGVDDTLDHARTYLRAELGNFYDSAKINTYLERGPEAIRKIQNVSEI